MKKLYGLIGYPLTHSFSEKYFNEKFGKEKIGNAEYKLFPIESINQLPEIITAHTSLAGINVTIPYKESVLQFATHLSEEVKIIGAANTLKIFADRIEASNTDVKGFEQSFTSGLKPFQKKAIILGTGGASKAVQFVLKKLGIDFLIVSRMVAIGRLCYEELDEKTMNDFLVVINTTPLGTYPAENTFPPIPYSHITQRHYFFDLVYNPSQTIFLTKAKEKGATIKNGYDMLQIQAEESWKIWNI